MHYDLYRINKSKELDRLGIFKDDLSSIKIIEWPELVGPNLANRLEVQLKYSQKEKERELSYVGYGK